MEPCTVGLVSAGVQAETGPSDPSEKRTQVPHPESSRPLPPAQRDGRSGTAALSWRPLLNRLRHLRQDRQMDFLPIPAHPNPPPRLSHRIPAVVPLSENRGSGKKRQQEGGLVKSFHSAEENRDSVSLDSSWTCSLTLILLNQLENSLLPG